MPVIQTAKILSPQDLLAKGVLVEIAKNMPELLTQTNGHPTKRSLEVHNHLLNLGKEVSESHKWQGTRGLESDEFITWRNKI
jgi:hypothetical protein